MKDVSKEEAGIDTTTMETGEVESSDRIMTDLDHPPIDEFDTSDDPVGPVTAKVSPVLSVVLIDVLVDRSWQLTNTRSTSSSSRKRRRRSVSSPRAECLLMELKIS